MLEFIREDGTLYKNVIFATAPGEGYIPTFIIYKYGVRMPLHYYTGKTLDDLKKDYKIIRRIGNAR